MPTSLASPAADQKYPRKADGAQGPSLLQTPRTTGEVQRLGKQLNAQGGKSHTKTQSDIQQDQGTLEEQFGTLHFRVSETLHLRICETLQLS